MFCFTRSVRESFDTFNLWTSTWVAEVLEVGPRVHARDLAFTFWTCLLDGPALANKLADYDLHFSRGRLRVCLDHDDEAGRVDTIADLMLLVMELGNQCGPLLHNRHQLSSSYRNP